MWSRRASRIARETRTMTGNELGMIDAGEDCILIELRAIEAIRARGHRI